MSADEQRALAAAFDPNRLEPAFYENPYPLYAALRRFDPVHRCPDGTYFLSRYADLDRIYRDRTAFSSDKKQAFAPKFGAHFWQPWSLQKQAPRFARRPVIPSRSDS